MYGGKKLRQLRQHLGFNQDDFATQLNISQPYYSAIESGKKKITNKIFDLINQKWKVDKTYFLTPVDGSIKSLVGGENGGENGGESDKEYKDRLKGMIVKSFPKMEFVYKSIEDLRKSHPELINLQYNISEISALLIDAESIYKTYLNKALNENIKAENYIEYREKLITHLQSYAKYQPIITPFLESLRQFVLIDFAKFDTEGVITVGED